MINVWTQNDLFHDPSDIILTSRTGISVMVDDDDAWPIENIIVEKKIVPCVEVDNMTNLIRHPCRDSNSGPLEHQSNT